MQIHTTSAAAAECSVLTHCVVCSLKAAANAREADLCSARSLAVPERGAHHLLRQSLLHEPSCTRQTGRDRGIEGAGPDVAEPEVSAGENDERTAGAEGAAPKALLGNRACGEEAGEVQGEAASGRERCLQAEEVKDAEAAAELLMQRLATAQVSIHSCCAMYGTGSAFLCDVRCWDLLSYVMCSSEKGLDAINDLVLRCSVRSSEAGSAAVWQHASNEGPACSREGETRKGAGCLLVLRCAALPPLVHAPSASARGVECSVRSWRRVRCSLRCFVRYWHRVSGAAPSSGCTEAVTLRRRSGEPGAQMLTWLAAVVESQAKKELKGVEHEEKVLKRSEKTDRLVKVVPVYSAKSKTRSGLPSTCTPSSARCGTSVGHAAPRALCDARKRHLLCGKVGCAIPEIGSAAL
eukprot:3662726-Rhodomonas_salina.6